VSGPRGIRPEVLADPRGALDALGARWSPDLDAYAAGQLDVSRVRCVLCGKAPCTCRQCEAPYLRWGATEPEPCGMTIGLPGVCPPGECPRGHVQPEPAEPGSDGAR